MIPTLYTLTDAAELLDVTVPWLRSPTMSTEARPAAPPSPAGLAPGSHFRRRIQRQQLL